MSASSIWNISEAEFPAQDSPRHRMGFALKYAALAPVVEPTQPLEFRIDDSSVDISARLDEPAAVADPDGRLAFFCCGARLHHLTLTLRHFGCLGRVEIFPDLAEPTLVARVHLGFCRERDALEHRLFAALSQPPPLGTVSNPVVSSEIVLAEISRAVARERGWLEFAQSETSRRRLAGLAAESDLGFASRGAPRELDSRRQQLGARLSWAHSRNSAAEGATVLPPGEARTMERTLPLPTCLAVVKTKTDDKHGWVVAGQAFARAALQAQALGVTWTCLSHIRRRSIRETLRTEIGHKGFAQTLLSFGGWLTPDVVRLDTPTTATATFR